MRSVNATDVVMVRGQMELWRPPPVDMLIIATSGRFTTDAVDLIEKNNGEGRVPRINMWPDSHLESLLATLPDLVDAFHLG